jgi:outer membrane lipoprotein-sorting protein
MGLKARAAWSSAAKILAVTALIIVVSRAAQAAPSGDEIAAKVKASYENLKTVSLVTAIEYKDGKNLLAMKASVSADMASGILRIEIVEHPVIEGQILIINGTTGISTVYMPVTSQAFRGPSAKVASAIGLDLSTINPEKLLNIDISTSLSVKYLRTEKIDRLSYYVVETRPKQAPDTYQLVWIDIETYSIKQVEAYDAARVRLVKVFIEQYLPNTKIDIKKLQELPKGTKLTDIK